MKTDLVIQANITIKGNCVGVTEKVYKKAESVVDKLNCLTGYENSFEIKDIINNKELGAEVYLTIHDVDVDEIKNIDYERIKEIVEN